MQQKKTSQDIQAELQGHGKTLSSLSRPGRRPWRAPALRGTYKKPDLIEKNTSSQTTNFLRKYPDEVMRNLKKTPELCGESHQLCVNEAWRSSEVSRLINKLKLNKVNAVTQPSLETVDMDIHQSSGTFCGADDFIYKNMPPSFEHQFNFTVAPFTLFEQVKQEVS